MMVIGGLAAAIDGDGVLHSAGTVWLWSGRFGDQFWWSSMVWRLHQDPLSVTVSWGLVAWPLMAN